MYYVPKVKKTTEFQKKTPTIAIEVYLDVK